MYHFIKISMLILIQFCWYLTGCQYTNSGAGGPKDPNSAFEFYSRALNQYQDKKEREALANVNKAIRLNPFIAQFYHLKGDILAESGAFRDALSTFQKAIEIRAYNPEIYRRMGEVCSEMKEFDEAVQYHKKAMAQEPMHIEINLRIAENYYWKNAYALARNYAENYYKKAILDNKELDPEYFRVMGNLEYAEHRYKPAVKFYEKYVGSSPQPRQKEVKFLLSGYMEIGEPEKAYNLLLDRGAVLLSEGDIHFFRGWYYYNHENDKDARIQLTLALQAGTSEIETYLFLGKIYYSGGEISKALEMFSRYRELGGRSIIEQDIP